MVSMAMLALWLPLQESDDPSIIPSYEHSVLPVNELTPTGHVKNPNSPKSLPLSVRMSVCLSVCLCCVLCICIYVFILIKYYFHTQRPAFASHHSSSSSDVNKFFEDCKYPPMLDLFSSEDGLDVQEALVGMLTCSCVLY